MPYVTRLDDEFRYEGERFKFVGFNYYHFNVGLTSLAEIRNVFGAAQAKGIKVFRTWCFDAGKPPTNSGGNFRYESGGVLNWREAQFVQLDTLLDEARKHGIKLILTLADNTSNYDTKNTYVNWANAVYASGLSTDYPYVGFFDSADCRTILKEFIFKLVNRVNTINGRTYKTDDTIFSWELGNEMRYDVFDAEGGTQNSAASTNIAKVTDWIEDIAAYTKSIDPNHMVGFSSMSHTWVWTQGDTVSNGSGYGACYLLQSQIAEIDYVDFHCYPTQGGSQLLKYGQRLGYPDAISGDGFRAQLEDYVAVAKAAGKPIICGEFGFVKDQVESNTYFPLNPRWKAVKEIMDVFFEADGDGMLLWSANTYDSGSYDINIKGNTGLATNNNSDDRPLMRAVTERIYRGSRIPASAS